MYLGMGDSGVWNRFNTASSQASMNRAKQSDLVADLKHFSLLLKSWNSVMEEGENVYVSLLRFLCPIICPILLLFPTHILCLSCVLKKNLYYYSPIDYYLTFVPFSSLNFSYILTPYSGVVASVPATATLVWPRLLDNVKGNILEFPTTTIGSSSVSEKQHL